MIGIWIFLIASLGVFCVGISKGGFAGSFVLVGVPLLTLVMSATEALALMLPSLCVMDMVVVYKYIRRVNWAVLWIIVPGAAVGILLASFALSGLPERYILILIGIVALVFTSKELFFAKQHAGDSSPGLQPIKGWVCSAVSGFTSTVAHAGGPPLAVYLLPLRLHKTALNATNGLYYLFVNLIKLVLFVYLGLLDWGHATIGLMLAPAAILGVLCGFWLHKRVNQQAFYTIVYWAMFFAGWKMIYDGVFAA